MSIKENREHISKCMMGSNNHQWKDYPRIIKDGHKHNKQNYIIKYNGKRVYSSTNYEKISIKLKELVKEIGKEKTDN